MSNIMTRDRQLNELQQMNQQFAEDSSMKFLQTSHQTATIYHEGRRIKDTNLNKFQNHLIKTKNDCEDKAKNHIFTSENHEN